MCNQSLSLQLSSGLQSLLGARLQSSRRRWPGKCPDPEGLGQCSRSLCRIPMTCLSLPSLFFVLSQYRRYSFKREPMPVVVVLLRPHSGMGPGPGPMPGQPGPGVGVGPGGMAPGPMPHMGPCPGQPGPCPGACGPQGPGPCPGGCGGCGPNPCGPNPCNPNMGVPGPGVGPIPGGGGGMGCGGPIPGGCGGCGGMGPGPVPGGVPGPGGPVPGGGWPAKPSEAQRAFLRVLACFFVLLVLAVCWFPRSRAAPAAPVPPGKSTACHSENEGSSLFE